MSWRRGKSQGWAAFDLKQQKKQGLELASENEPYPPISNTNDPLRPCQNPVNNNGFSTRSFSSVVLPSASFLSLTPSEDLNKSLQIGESSTKTHGNMFRENNIVENEVDLSYEKLNELYSWADRSLIGDVLAAVNNDADKASTLLKNMVLSESIHKNEDRNSSELKYDAKRHIMNNETYLMDKETFSGEPTNNVELSYVLDDYINYRNKELTDSHVTYPNTKINFDDSMDMKLILEKFGSVPVEPEWEEDDIYLIHRRDAIKMMRLASRNSRSATDAYLRGDHFSAQWIAQKAQEEWSAAEKLNAKAAKEILSIRNCKNDLWKLDLHGLHAVEAVQALKDHLHKIESQVPLNDFSSANKVNLETRIVCSASSQSRQRSSSFLEVITGKGIHSRGQATLPTAIKSFLSENRYHYEETRPGVITVRPKFQLHHP